MHEQDFVAVLASHGATDLGQCFLIKDARTGRYSAGTFDRNGKPFLLMEDDEAFNAEVVRFLRENEVRTYESVSELIR